MEYFTVWQQTGLSECMERVDCDLNHKQKKKYTCYLEESFDVYEMTKTSPTPGKRRSCQHSKKRTVYDPWIPNLNQHESSFHTFSGDHQKGEEKDTYDCCNS